MAAQCAACLAPIRAGDQVVSDTEVFHRACVPNASRSILTKFRIALKTAKAKLATAERQAALERAEAASERVRAMTLESQLENARTRLRTTESMLKTEHQLLEDERRRNRSDREEAATAMRRHAELLIENDRLRAELQLHRVLGPAPATRADAKADTAQDGKDPAEIRAALLELD